MQVEITLPTYSHVCASFRPCLCQELTMSAWIVPLALSYDCVNIKPCLPLVIHILEKSQFLAMIMSGLPLQDQVFEFLLFQYSSKFDLYLASALSQDCAITQTQAAFAAVSSHAYADSAITEPYLTFFCFFSIKEVSTSTKPSLPQDKAKFAIFEPVLQSQKHSFDRISLLDPILTRLGTSFTPLLSQYSSQIC